MHVLQIQNAENEYEKVKGAQSDAWNGLRIGPFNRPLIIFWDRTLRTHAHTHATRPDNGPIYTQQ